MNLYLVIQQADIPIQDKLNLSKVYGEEIVIQTLEGIILFFLFGALFFTIYILIHRTILNRKLKYLEARKIIFDNYLISLIENQQDSEEYQTKNYKTIDTPSLDIEDIADEMSREILLKRLLSLHKQLQGEEAKIIKQAYLTLGFKNFAVKKLNSFRWDKIISGLKELMQMRIRDGYKDILKLLNHRNDSVRTTAMKAYILLNTDPLDFLLTLKEELSDWQKKEILISLEQLELEFLPDFKKYLVAQNDSVIEFVFFLIAHFNQDVESSILINYMNHPNVLVRLSTIQTAGVIGGGGVKKALKDRYMLENHGLKIEIIKALSLLATSEDVYFFEELALSESASIAIPCIVSLKRIQDKSIDYLIKSVMDEANKAHITKLVAHVNSLN